MNLRIAFQGLLADTARLHGWTLIPELSEKSFVGRVQPDGTLRDSNGLPRGYWEAKDWTQAMIFVLSGLGNFRERTGHQSLCRTRQQPDRC